MKRIALLTAATAAAALAAASSAAATPSTASATAARGAAEATAEARAVATADRHSARLGLGAAERLVRRDVVLDAGGAQHVRFDRTYAGLPVLGGDVVLHSSAQGTYRGASGLARSIRISSTKPAVTGQRAAAIAVGKLAGRPLRSTPRLAVDAKGTPALVWNVNVKGVRADRTPSDLHVLVDARTGTVRDAWDTVHTADDKGFHVGTVDVAATHNGSVWELKDSHGNTTTDMNNGTTGNGTLFTDSDNIWGDGTLSNRQTVAVDAHYGVGKTWDYYSSVHGREGIADDGKGALTRVHYSSKYNNASWSDSCFCMTYGDGDGTTYNPFTQLDVAGHEMSHGVTSSTAGLRYSGESGGLNEATSDIFGTAVEFYTNNAADNPDYLIGEKLRIGSSTPLRYMDKPSKDGKSADCWSRTVGRLNVHYSSGVGNHFFYLLAEGSGAKTINGVAYDSPTCNSSTVAGIGLSKAEKIWYKALTSYMTSTTTYKGARTATLNAARDIHGSGSTEYAAVAAAWSAVNVS